MNEVIVITGARGTGKSTLAATRLPPSRVGEVYVHDSENSMNNINVQLAKANLSFGRYVDLKARFHDLPSDDDLLDRINKGVLPWVNDQKLRASLADYYEYVLSDLAENLIHEKYTVYIHDTLEKLEAGMTAWVEANKKTAGVTTLAYGGLWTAGVYPLYENLLAALFSRGIETVILCSHLKNVWEGNRPVPGKTAPSGKSLLYRVSSFMLWLVNDRGNADGAPAGLVLKERLGELAVEDDKWKPRRMLPQRIPHCTWGDVERYLREGCDLENPAPGEAMSDAEKEMISELISDEQMRLMILDAEKELEEIKGGALLSSKGTFKAPNEKAAEPIDDSLRKEVLELAEEGENKSSIAQKLDVSLPRVIRILKEAGQ